jgi:hypothetical protein
VERTSVPLIRTPVAPSRIAMPVVAAVIRAPDRLVRPPRSGRPTPVGATTWTPSRAVRSAPVATRMPVRAAATELSRTRRRGFAALDHETLVGAPVTRLRSAHGARGQRDAVAARAGDRDALQVDALLSPTAKPDPAPVARRS